MVNDRRLSKWFQVLMGMALILTIFVMAPGRRLCQSLGKKRQCKENKSNRMTMTAVTGKQENHTPMMHRCYTIVF